MSELLNCPLCNASAQWHVGSNNQDNAGATCKFCGLELWDQGPGCMDRAAEAWNRRPDPVSVGSALEQLSESDKDVALGQAVEFAEYVVGAAKGTMVERAQRFLSLPYSQEMAARLKPAPVGVRVPEKKNSPDHFDKYCMGYDDAIDEVLQLNPQLGAVVRDQS